MQLTDKQWALLKVYEDRNYVDFIRGHIVRDYPALADDPTLRERLNTAYGRTKELGFTYDRQIVQFLYFEAIAPGFYTKPAIARWLGKTGMPSEQRFDMAMDVARAKLRDKKENR
ncbi:hypothetical protein EN871_21785 [bacterium M00.F.Ca.ET.228.01.1.1]|uniref:hypothetical protein n=1 Tax=Paraburkholderia phenoliruptrix TaxID=252970 RepID=UPI0010920856|nr:hypothetical protein [Paraburkholderia phenoliruptrix]TGP41625.1 hypothetical protein EN871_21785 [bacterium M00.F.Ca.ET.228.01.1.1]TGR98416.1 hypothetical protein EN834_21400 [bacterium M00.F.Ca.ET.191.01.1.1]TGU02750.1 hypothetical protein EN798_22220 [bacterium M00.F.Ca.ET.155.01.1.1]MBW0447580.1 hypothetical protein [Paraburkholderia phenoliruptrix]MBW9098217.1 hypothetical protein [Paraburkholderia phenoliruptrix]